MLLDLFLIICIAVLAGNIGDLKKRVNTLTKQVEGLIALDQEKD